MLCLNCSKETNNPKFCSKSCSAIFNNKIYRKRKITNHCSSCGDLIPKRNKFCKKCRECKTINYSLKEIKNLLSVKGKHPSWLFSTIRNFCRTKHKNLTLLPCKICGYDKHVELCHIKAISSFPDSSTVKEINDEKNIIQLCRNCHWEFDNGLINLQ